MLQNIAASVLPVWLHPLVLLDITPPPSASVPVVPSLILQSPQAAKEWMGIFTIFPSLFYKDASISNDDIAGSNPCSRVDVTFSIAEFRNQFARLKMKWSSAFHDIEANHLIMAANMEQLALGTRTLAAALGSPLPFEGKHFANMWQAVQGVAGSVKMTTAAQSMLQSMVDKVSDLELSCMDFSSTQSQLQQVTLTLQSTLQKHEARFGKILPILMGMQHQAQLTSSSSLLWMLLHYSNSLPHSLLPVFLQVLLHYSNNSPRSLRW